MAESILVLEDDPAMQSFLTTLLNSQQYQVQSFSAGLPALQYLVTQPAALILLDLGLADMDGQLWLQQLRSWCDTPVIVISARHSEQDKVQALDNGANDYVTKPFKFPVLLARIRAQLRQHEQSEDAVFQLGPYTFKPAMKMLITEDDKKIRLTEKETNILKFLYRSSEGVVARDVLLHEVWGYNAGVTTHTLETHIYRLRQKIEPDPSNARLLVTESGGYRLVA